MIHRCSLALVVLALASPAAAEVVSLETLERRALEQNPSLDAVSAQARGARAALRKAKSAHQPRLGLSIDGTASPGRQLVTVRDETGTSYLVQGSRELGDTGAFEPQLRYGLGLDLDSNLYDFGRTSLAIAAGKTTHAAVQAQREAARSELAHAVRDAYLIWLNAHELARYAGEAAGEAQTARERAAALVSEGSLPRAELAPAEAEALLSRIEHERALGELANARLALEQVVGAPLPENGQPDLSILERSPIPATKVEVPRLRALRLEQSAARLTARSYRRERAPRLAATTSAGLRFQGYQAFPAYSVGLSLIWAAWDGGIAAADAEIQEARAAELEARMREERQRAELEISRAKLEAESAEARLELADSLQRAAETHVREVQAGYETGARDLTELHQAKALFRRALSEVLAAKLARAASALRTAPVAR